MAHTLGLDFKSEDQRVFSEEWMIVYEGKKEELKMILLFVSSLGDLEI
jgi:hypothetical protein